MDWQKYDPSKHKNSDTVKSFEKIYENIQKVIVELKETKRQLEETRDDGTMAK